MDEIIKKLRLATTYAEDGARFTAAMIASEAVTELLKAHVEVEKLYKQLTEG